MIYLQKTMNCMCVTLIFLEKKLALIGLNEQIPGRQFIHLPLHVHTAINYLFAK